MKKHILILACAIVALCTKAQEQTLKGDSYNMFDCQNCNNKYFIATNSGIQNTPIGIRFGFLCKTGAYIGTRLGQGKIAHSRYLTYSEETGEYVHTGDSTSQSNLFSVTGGFIKPIVIQNNFSLHAFIGAGYGQWWDYRWEHWTKEGYELEGGLMLSFKRLMLNASANMLDGYKTYATWDFTVGLGYRF